MEMGARKEKASHPHVLSGSATYCSSAPLQTDGQPAAEIGTPTQKKQFCHRATHNVVGTFSAASEIAVRQGKYSGSSFSGKNEEM